MKSRLNKYMIMRRLLNVTKVLIYDTYETLPSKVINSYFGLIICIFIYHIITYEDRIYIHLLNTRNIIRYSKLIANDEA